MKVKQKPRLLVIDGKSLTLEGLWTWLEGPTPVVISADAAKRVASARRLVDKIVSEGRPVYGINTGFGALSGERIAPELLETLQQNLIRSHAAGVGDELPPDVVRLMMLLRANVLARGYSGISPSVLNVLVDFINHDIVPIVPSQGSVGASGDLAPLAHIALALMGEGEVFYKDQKSNIKNQKYGMERMEAREALKRAGILKPKLAHKEGLSLINGIEATKALMVVGLRDAKNLIDHANVAAALSVEGLLASSKPFDPRVSDLKPHPGVVEVASVIRRLIKDSQIIASHKDCKRVQDPYSLRCVPQIHGACLDAYEFAAKVVETELNSVSDNPLVYPDEIISGGNFHGASLAMAADFLGAAVTILGLASERRTEHMINPKAGEIRERCLVKNPGLNSGMMIAHTTAASLASENKVLSHPASVDTIPTSLGHEDVVSQSMWAARKLRLIVANTMYIVAIELMCAAQAIDLNEKGLSPGYGTKAVYKTIRRYIPPLKEDRVLSCDIERIYEIIKSGEILRAITG